MKKNGLITVVAAIAVVLLTLLGSVRVKAEIRQVTLTESTRLPAGISRVDSLSVSGPIKQSDFSLLWEAAFKFRLVYLDLSKAEPEGGKLPDQMFCHLSEQSYQADGITEVRRARNLRKVILPASTVSIGAMAFAYTDIESIELPSSVREIGASCFLGCRLLKGKVVIPEGVKRLENNLFYQCGRLEEVSLPSALEYIGDRCFSGCGNMKLTNPQLPVGIKAIADHAFFGTQNLHEIALPAGVLDIGCESFRESGLRKIVVPPSVESIQYRAFFRAADLREVEFNEGLGAIGREAFYGTSLEKIIFPESLDAIWEGAFANIPTLKEVYSLDKNACVAISDIINGEGKSGVPSNLFAFYGHTPRNIPLYVPVGSSQSYTRPGWSWFTNVVERADMPQLGGSGISQTEVNEPSISIKGEDGQISVVASQNDVDVEIYSVDGRLAARGQTIDGRGRFILSKGIYIVRAGDVSAKIAI